MGLGSEERPEERKRRRKGEGAMGQVHSREGWPVRVGGAKKEHGK